MDRHISNPIKINAKLYGWIIIGSVVLIIIGVLGAEQCHFLRLLENLGCGAFASAIVALIIDMGNTRKGNQKANQIYDAVYGEVRFQILNFAQRFPVLFRVAFPNDEQNNERHFWFDWYTILKQSFLACDSNRQKELLVFFCDILKEYAGAVSTAIGHVTFQKYLLEINGLYNAETEQAFCDFAFEFEALERDLAAITNPNVSQPLDFWVAMDAIVGDLRKYIDNWKDTRFCNFYKFGPNDNGIDKAEMVDAYLQVKAVSSS